MHAYPREKVCVRGARATGNTTCFLHHAPG